MVSQLSTTSYSAVRSVATSCWFAERPLTSNIRPGAAPLHLAGYERAGGHAALRKALQSLSPEDVAREVTDSKLRGYLATTFSGSGFGNGKTQRVAEHSARLPSSPF
jgi:NADH-quinone oxidoreductase subunit F